MKKLNLSKYRKLLVALATLLSSVASLSVLPDKYQATVDSALALLGAYGVYAVPNVDYPVEKG